MLNILKKMDDPVLVQQMLQNQKELNATYNPDWKSVPALSYGISALHEFSGEFMAEIEGLWSFFGDKKVDKEAALFELTDFWFFYLSRVLVTEKTPRCPSHLLRNLQSSQTDNLRIAHTLKNMVEELAQPLCQDPRFMLECVRLLVVNVLEQPFAAFLEAYELKRERNLYRAAKGALEGKYDKSEEGPLQLTEMV